MPALVALAIVYAVTLACVLGRLTIVLQMVGLFSLRLVDFCSWFT